METFVQNTSGKFGQRSIQQMQMMQQAQNNISFRDIQRNAIQRTMEPMSQQIQRRLPSAMSIVQ